MVGVLLWKLLGAMTTVDHIVADVSGKNEASLAALRRAATKSGRTCSRLGVMVREGKKIVLEVDETEKGEAGADDDDLVEWVLSREGAGQDLKERLLEAKAEKEAAAALLKEATAAKRKATATAIAAHKATVAAKRKQPATTSSESVDAKYHGQVSTKRGRQSNADKAKGMAKKHLEKKTRR